MTNENSESITLQEAWNILGFSDCNPLPSKSLVISILEEVVKLANANNPKFELRGHDVEKALCHAYYRSAVNQNPEESKMEEKVAGLLSNEQHATLSQLIVSYRKSAVSHALATNGRGSSLRSPSSLYDDMQQAETALSTYLTELQQTEVPKSALITTEVSLRFKLDCEKVKSKNLEDEVRELKERFNRMRLLRDEYAVVAAAANRYLASTEPTNSITTQQEVEAAKVEAVVSRDALMSALQNLN